MKEKILEQFPELVQSWGPKVLLALLLLAVFWLASRFVRKAIFAAGEKADLEYPVVRLMAMATRVTLLVAGLVTALGFAIKDTISNILAGVLLLVYRPFSKTDYVEVKGMEGEVTAIDLRYTTLQHDGQKILLPNSLLFTNPITIGKPSEG